MTPDADLFEMVRDKLLRGLLWPLTDGSVVAGPATDFPCFICDQPITAADTDYEAQGPTAVIHVHVACYQAWSGESQQSA